MPPSKTYEPHCPAYNCTGGRALRLLKVSAESVKICPEVLSRKTPGDEIYRCNYCGFVWFQSSSSRPGFDTTPAGFYDDYLNPNIFIAVSEDYQIREINTPLGQKGGRTKRGQRPPRHY